MKSTLPHRVLAALSLAALVAALLAQPVGAQLIGALPAVPLPSLPVQPGAGLPVVGPVLTDLLQQPEARRVVQPTLDSIGGLPATLADAGGPTLLELRRLRLRELVRTSGRALETDPAGQPVRRGVLVVLAPDERALQQALRSGFRVAMDDRIEDLGIRVVTLAVPAGLTANQGLKRLRAVSPELQADFDHVFEPAGGDLLPAAAALATAEAGRPGVRIGMIDGGVAAHPSLAGATIEQSGFAGSPQPTGHGTAVASLLVGNQGRFQGAARGAELFVADVYSGSRAAGSATAIARALGWLASKRVTVINISLVGPPNRLLGQAIEAVRNRGIGVVAAVGNDGPAAPPQYPASYPGVLAITGVDARGRALPEAGKAAHLDFAAPGADMAAASPGQGYARVRGTSFAAPLAAARLAFSGPQRLPTEAAPGHGRVGRGVLCAACRVDPAQVGAK